MLTERHFNALRTYGVAGMGEKLREIVDDQRYDGMTFEERVALMIDAEVDRREARRVTALVSKASFRNPSACVEEILYLPERKLQKDRILRVAKCGWVDRHEVVVVISASGRGKSYVAQAIGVSACRRGHRVRYARLSEVFEDLDCARARGSLEYDERLAYYKGVEVLILDDFLITPAGPSNSVALYEIILARDGLRATLIASAVEPEEWHMQVDGPLVSNAILSRLASGSTYIDIAGPNMRERVAKGGEGGASG